MKKMILLWSVVLVGFLAVAYAADPGSARPDLFGTPPSQWNYTLALTTTTVSTIPGLLGKVVIPVTCAVPVTVYDSTTTTISLLNVPIATMTATAGLTYDFTGLRTTNGLTISIGSVCTSGAVVTYR